MSLDQLLALREAYAFDPAPRHADLGLFHVPFDDLTARLDCEHRLERSLRAGGQVALIGDSGVGKSSVLEATVLHPLAEGLAPLEMLVSVGEPEVATDPLEFTRAFVQTVARYVAHAHPAEADAARDFVERTAPTVHGSARRLRRIGIAPSWMGARVELTADLQAATEVELPRAVGEIVDQATGILALIVSHGLQPVLVVDDTDKWLAEPERDKLVSGFFDRVVRLIGERLAVAAVVAVHTHYLTMAEYLPARGFLDTQVFVPRVPDAEGLRRILGRRIEVALGEDRVDDVVAGDAITELMRHYATVQRLRETLLIAHTALAYACDVSAERLDAAAVRSAIADYPWLTPAGHL